MNFTQELQQELDALYAKGNLRHLPRLEHDGRYVTTPDYLNTFPGKNRFYRVNYNFQIENQ